jgi:tetratricopeptide (TPR) repeat protein
MMFFHKIKIPLLILLLLSFLPGISYSQDVDIVPYLKRIENGNADDVRLELPGLKQNNPNSPSVMFLEGVLTENGQKAVLLYQEIVDKYPDSKYADAALYRIYTYYYALGLYESADKKLNDLTNNYPQSPYIKIAKHNQLPVNPEITREDDVTGGKDSVKVKDVVTQEKYKYTIQAGAFSVQKNAENLREEFKKSGLYSEIKIKMVGGTNFHIVYVGQFATETDAESSLKTLNNKFNLTGRVVMISR